jgi:hypothetical protein
MSKEVLAVAMDKKQATKSRIAAIYTVKQLLGEKSHPHFLNWLKIQRLQSMPCVPLPIERPSLKVYQ